MTRKEKKRISKSLARYTLYSDKLPYIESRVNYWFKSVVLAALKVETMSHLRDVRECAKYFYYAGRNNTLDEVREMRRNRKSTFKINKARDSFVVLRRFKSYCDSADVLKNPQMEESND